MAAAADEAVENGVLLPADAADRLRRTTDSTIGRHCRCRLEPSPTVAAAEPRPRDGVGRYSMSICFDSSIPETFGSRTVNTPSS